MKIKIKFFGQTVGALGTNHQITETIEVENTEQKTLYQALHEKGYEMLTWIQNNINMITPEETDTDECKLEWG